MSTVNMPPPIPEMSPVNLPQMGANNYINQSGMSLQGHSNAPNLTDTVANQSHMQKLILEEKSRSEKHKLNYEKLKKQTDQLNSEFKTQGYELQNKNEEINRMKEKFNNVIGGLESELKRKSQQIEELESQALSSEKMEAIKFQVISDLQTTFKQRMQDMELDVEKYRGDFNKLRHDHAFLKSEYEKQAYEYSKNLEELNFKRESEKNELLASKEQVAKIAEDERLASEDKIKSHVKENAFLKQRLLSQQAMNSELNQQLEKLRNDTDLRDRGHVKNITDLEAKIKIFEMEKVSLSSQIEKLKTDIIDQVNQLRDKEARMNEIERDNQRVLHDNESLSHQISIKEGELKLAMTKFVNYDSEQTTKLKELMEDAITEKEVAFMQVEKFKQMSANKERDFTRRLEKSKEAHGVELNQILEEKAQLESGLITAESDVKTLTENLKEQKFDLNVSVTECSNLKEELSKFKAENEEFKGELLLKDSDLKEKGQEIASLEKSVDELQFQVKNLSSQFETCNIAKDSFEKQNVKLNSQVREMETSLITIKHSERSQYQGTLQEWFQEKSKLNAKINDLTRENEVLEKKLNRAAKVHLGMKTSLRNKVANLKKLLDESIAKIKFLEHNEQKTRGIARETHDQLRKEYKALLRQHEHFKDIVRVKSNYDHAAFVPELAKSAKYDQRWMHSDWLMNDPILANRKLNERLLRRDWILNDSGSANENQSSEHRQTQANPKPGEPPQHLSEVPGGLYQWTELEQARRTLEKFKKSQRKYDELQHLAEFRHAGSLMYDISNFTLPEMPNLAIPDVPGSDIFPDLGISPVATNDLLFDHEHLMSSERIRDLIPDDLFLLEERPDSPHGRHGDLLLNESEENRGDETLPEESRPGENEGECRIV